MGNRAHLGWSDQGLQESGSRKPPPGSILASNAVYVLSGIFHLISNPSSSRARIQHLHLPVARIFWERSFGAAQPRVWSTPLWLAGEHGQRVWVEAGGPGDHRVRLLLVPGPASGASVGTQCCLSQILGLRFQKPVVPHLSLHVGGHASVLSSSLPRSEDRIVPLQDGSVSGSRVQILFLLLFSSSVALGRLLSLSLGLDSPSLKWR